MSLADELLADLDEVGGDVEEEDVQVLDLYSLSHCMHGLDPLLHINTLRCSFLCVQTQNEEVVEAMEGFYEDHGDAGSQSVRVMAKLLDSDQVRGFGEKWPFHTVFPLSAKRSDE